MSMKSCFLWIVIWLFMSLDQSIAGALSEFELAQSMPVDEELAELVNTKRSSQNNEDKDDDNDGFALLLTKLVFYAAFYALSYGGEVSDRRVADRVEWKNVETNSEGFTDINQRQVGELLIPQYRFDMNYQVANAGITAWDTRFEYGWGRFGVQLRYTRLKEEDEPVTLAFSQVHGLYRLSFGNYVGINLGIGIAQLSGNNRARSLSLTFPVYFHFSKSFGLEIKPTLVFFDNAEILDLDYSVIFSRNTLSVMLGYRELVKTGLDITGPYLGVTYHY